MTRIERASEIDRRAVGGDAPAAPGIWERMVHALWDLTERLPNLPLVKLFGAVRATSTRSAA